MSTEQIDVDHGFYIDAVVQALKAAGLTVVEYEALADTHREAYIILAPAADTDHSIALTWHEENGWQNGFTEADRAEKGIQCLSELIHDEAYLHTVAFPTIVADAVLRLNLAEPDDINDALATYLPAGPKPEPEDPDPSDPRQIATDLIHEHARDEAMRRVRDAVAERFDLKVLGVQGYAAKVEEVRQHIIKATVTVEIPDEVIA